MMLTVVVDQHKLGNGLAAVHRPVVVWVQFCLLPLILRGMGGEVKYLSV